MTEEPKECPEGFLYRGIEVAPQTPRFKSFQHGEPEPTCSWIAKGEGWTIYAPTTDVMKRAIDEQLGAE